MAGFVGQLLSCWTSVFVPPSEEVVQREDKQELVPRTERQLQGSPQASARKNGDLSTAYTATRTIPEPSEAPIVQEQETGWGWEEEEEEANEQEHLEDLILPSSPIKATFVTEGSIFGKKAAEPVEEEDFFSDMEPEVVPAKTVFLQERIPETRLSARLQMSLEDDEEDDIVSRLFSHILVLTSDALQDVGAGWGDAPAKKIKAEPTEEDFDDF
jgi:hypothetical protein